MFPPLAKSFIQASEDITNISFTFCGIVSKASKVSCTIAVITVGPVLGWIINPSSNYSWDGISYFWNSKLSVFKFGNIESAKSKLGNGS